MRFEFATSGRIVFGAGARREVAPIVASYGRRAALVTGRSPARAEPVAADLRQRGVSVELVAVEGEPTIDDVRAQLQRARAASVDVVVAVGGGSAIDAGKAVAALLTNGGDPLDYLEVVGRGRALGGPAAPFVAVPTTAGTGAEVTRNAVLGSPAHGVKVSLRSPLMLPRAAIVDPELALGLPPGVTARTGLDALTQLIEPYLSLRANPVTDGFCVEGITRVARALKRAVSRGDDLAAREDMALASLLGGLALANAGLGAVHGIAAAVGGMVHAPHGAICAALLPHVLAVNLEALAARAAGSVAVPRARVVAQLLTGRPGAAPEDAVVALQALVAELPILPLGRLGVTREAVPALADAALRASSMQANPIALTAGEGARAVARAM